MYFALEHPDQPANVRTNAIPPEQCRNFRIWLDQANRIPAKGYAALTKEHLKNAYEREKTKNSPKIKGFNSHQVY